MTKSLSENKEIVFKKATNHPKGENNVVLAWFSSNPVIPSNNLSITDLSAFTPENSYASLATSSLGTSKSKLAYANELGVLEDENGNSIFDSENVSISDCFLNEDSFERIYTISDVSQKAFCHSYYISKYYTMLYADSFVIESIDSFIPEEKIPKSIKVVDENNNEYVDATTGKKRYRILLDKVFEDIYKERTNRPYKVVVLLDDPEPRNLQLIYDKVTLSSTESISSVVVGYRENINTVSLFNKVMEESFASDNSMRNNKIFSQKSITEKNNLLSNLSRTDGFEIVVPKKAVSDNRTYETFNWRLITAVQRSIDVSSVNNSEEIDSESNLKQKTVNCAVLCTTAQLSSMRSQNNYASSNPYVFYRLANSVYNLSKYTFLNPIRNGSPTTADYWLVSIDEVSESDLAKFDILTWSPSADITREQGQKLKYFVKDTQGTLFLDLSQAAGAENIDSSLVASSEVYDLNSWTYNSNNLFFDERKNGAWPINDSFFETVEINSTTSNIYSVFGRSISGSSSLGQANYKKIKEFTANFNNENVALFNSRSKPIVVGIGYAKPTDALISGNILATTASTLRYVNDIYQPSSIFDISTSNSGSISIEEKANQMVVTAATERSV